MNADQIVDLLTTAGTLALVACPILAAATAGAARIAWEQAKDRHRAEAYAESLKRRLEDVEAIRKRDLQRSRFIAVDPAGKDREAIVTGTVNEDGSISYDSVTTREQAERLARRDRERAHIDGRHGGPIPPSIPDDGSEGTDVRQLSSIAVEDDGFTTVVPSMIRDHLGEPPYRPEPWHDEFGRECG